MIKTLYLSVLAFSSALALSRCGQQTYGQMVLARSEMDDLTATGTDTSSLAPIAVDVYMHAVANSSSSPTYLSV